MVDSPFSVLYTDSIFSCTAPNRLTFQSGGKLKEIVQKIIETEQEVREKIEVARKEAQDIVRRAEAQSRELEEQKRQEAVKQAQELIERLKREAERERDSQVENVKGGSKELIEKKGGEIDRAVERVTDLIIGIEHD